MSRWQIVIVGGGFSGTALAIQLLRRGDERIAVTVIEPRKCLAEGVAYSTCDPVHRINVPAQRMQLSSSEEGEFERWYRQHPDFDLDREAIWQDGNIYPQRRYFAAYIREKLEQAKLSSPVNFRHIHDSAEGYQNGRIITAQQGEYRADQVILAISHPAPSVPNIFIPFLKEGRIISDPWQVGALTRINNQESVAIIGTGLTMCDVVASLARQGHQGSITAISRRGLIPRSNVSAIYADSKLTVPLIPHPTVRRWLRQIRQEVKHAEQHQLPWQLVFDDIRRQGQIIWQQLSHQEQRRFLRHLRPWWDVHRYRIAPQVAAVQTEYLDSTQLRIKAARIQSVTQDQGKVRLILRQRHAGNEVLWVDRVILTTGPAHQDLIHRQPLLADLLAQDLIQADPLGLGIAVNRQAQAINSTGKFSHILYVVGPAARGQFGELMGLPQVADHAEFVAQQLLSALPFHLNERCPDSVN